MLIIYGLIGSGLAFMLGIAAHGMPLRKYLPWFFTPVVWLFWLGILAASFFKESSETILIGGVLTLCVIIAPSFLITFLWARRRNHRNS